MPKIRFHDLRHSYTTLLLINNFDLKAVSELLGHASTIVTNANYFDKDKIVIDCTKELNEYIDRVKPKLKENIEEQIINIDTNLLVNKFLLKTKNCSYYKREE